MRPIVLVPLALTIIAQGGCGKNEAGKTDAVATEAPTVAAVKERPQPGKYRVTTRITHYSMPGMPAAAAQQMQGMFSQTGQSAEFCLTPEQASKGYEDMTRRTAQGDCRYDRFSARDGKLDAAMTCTPGQGMTTVSTVAGTFSAEGSRMKIVADAKGEHLPGGAMHMESEVTTERIGDC